jgi:hypothetical protein
MRKAPPPENDGASLPKPLFMENSSMSYAHSTFIAKVSS